MSTTQLIFQTSNDEFEAHNRLADEIRIAEQNGFEPDPEVVEALEAIHADWDAQQQAEIDAENAWLRYAEGGWDKTGEYSRELYEINF